MRSKLVSALIVFVLLVGSLGIFGTLSAGPAPDGPAAVPSTSVVGSSPGVSAPIPSVPAGRAVQPDLDGPRTDDPAAFPAVLSERRIEQNPVLIFQDELPWGFDSIQQILTGAGIGYDVLLSDEIPFVDLGHYELVIIPSVQPSGFYTTLNAHIGRLEDYVAGGGKLWMSGCTQGDTPLIPGGVVNTFGTDSYNVITETGHPWVQGVPNPIYGTSASHNHLTNLLPGTVVVATAQTSGFPTLIEYNLGAGHVAVTGQTLEFAWTLGQDGGPILPQSLLYMFHFNKPWILNLTTTDTTQSARRVLSELGYSYYTHYASDWTGINFDPYDVVLITMDGGLVEAPSVQKIRTDVIDRGKRAFFIGGSALPDFVLGVNQYLVQSNTSVYNWAISSVPHWTLTNPGHELAAGLPGSYNFVTPQASYYQLRVTDPVIEVIGENGDGHPAFFYKRQVFPLAGAGIQQGGSLVWFINSPYESYWVNPADFDVLKQIIANGISYSTRYVYLPATLLNYPEAWDAFYEPNDHWLDAYGPLVSGQAYLAYPDDQEDYYTFTLPGARTVDVVVSNYAPTSDNGQLLVYGPAVGNERGPLVGQFGLPGQTEMRIDDLALGAGKYYVRIFTSGAYSNSQLYTLRVTY